MAADNIIYISCGIFRAELEYLVREKGLDWNIIFLDAGLHVNFDKLKNALVETLERHSAPDVKLKVIYGYCHPDIVEILHHYGAQKLSAGNCLESMIGAEEVMRLNAEATAFFLSAGWVNNWEHVFDAGKADFDFDFKSMFTNYKRIIVFDTGVIPIDESKVQRFSAFTGLPVERRMITLDYFFERVNSIRN
jgi:hypothetical protein